MVSKSIDLIVTLSLYFPKNVNHLVVSRQKRQETKPTAIPANWSMKIIYKSHVPPVVCALSLPPTTMKRCIRLHNNRAENPRAVLFLSFSSRKIFHMPTLTYLNEQKSTCPRFIAIKRPVRKEAEQQNNNFYIVNCLSSPNSQSRADYCFNAIKQNPKTQTNVNSPFINPKLTTRQEIQCRPEMQFLLHIFTPRFDFSLESGIILLFFALCKLICIIEVLLHAFVLVFQVSQVLSRVQVVRND